MKWIGLTIGILIIVASVICFSVWQYNETQRKFIQDGFQHCPYQGAYGYYWAKNCK